MKKRLLLALIVLIGIFLLSASIVWAATIQGRIVGALFENMPVTIYNASCGDLDVYDTTETLPDGSFVFYNVPDGYYQVQPDSFDYIWHASPMQTWNFDSQFILSPYFGELIFYSGCCK